MTSYPYQLVESDVAALGLIVLKSDETIEREFRAYFPPSAANLLVTRVPSGDAVTPETLAKMSDDIPSAVGLLPTGLHLDVVGYGCTSGATLIGADKVADLVGAAVSVGAVTNPLTAGLAAADALGIKRMGIVSPYVASVAEPLREAFEAGGLEVPDTISFGEMVEAKVARIDPVTIANAARELHKRAALDGIFLSCTNLQTIEIIASLETDLGIPILSSNQVLAWHMSRLSTQDCHPAPVGRLFGA